MFVEMHCHDVFLAPKTLPVRKCRRSLLRSSPGSKPVDPCRKTDTAREPASDASPPESISVSLVLSARRMSRVERRRRCYPILSEHVSSFEIRLRDSRRAAWAATFL